MSSYQQYCHEKQTQNGGVAADRYDALGQEKAANYFADNQHTTKAGARLNAESVVEGLKQLKDCPLVKDLASAPAATSAP